jgi:hypothetical protein
MKGRPFATDSPNKNSYLPSESENLDLHDRGDSKGPIKQFVSATSLCGVGTFGREAQATFLLGHVLEVVKAVRFDDATQIEVLRIDGELQVFLSTVMEQCAGTWGKYCGALSMCITYVYFSTSITFSVVSKMWQGFVHSTPGDHNPILQERQVLPVSGKFKNCS